MAAKVITNGKLYDAKADIWSLGITLYEMFSDLTPAKVILKIPRSQPAKLEGTQFSNPVKEFLAACLIDEPNDRPTAEDLSDISLSDQTNPGCESLPLDKADWDFMENYSELDSCKMDGINSINLNDQPINPSSKDGPVTLRPH
ncbi:hypothetical protein Pst134EB_003987 [Puccinia striiformis f. sp. tritici]|nr:hypothetical protein Pst134EB_003987 [Puccinia striiformis f. sp. tritici]